MQKTIAAVFIWVMALSGAPAVAAPLQYVVEIDTSTFAVSPLTPFSLNIQLNDGGTPGSNSAILSGWEFGGGSPSGTPDVFGGAFGDLSTGVTLQDSDFFNSFTQSFIAGSFLRFQLNLTTNADPSGTPDQFSLAILDNTLTELATMSAGLYGTSVLLLADLIGSGTSLLPFGSAPGPSPAFAAPSLTAPAAIPEPATFALIALGCIGLRFTRRRGAG
jgi:hypothetical protein